MLKRDDLIGTWRLRSWKNTGSDGSEVEPLGDNPIGYISYHDHGYMSVEIMHAVSGQRCLRRHAERALGGDQQLPRVRREVRSSRR